MPPEAPTRPAVGLQPASNFRIDRDCFACGTHNAAGLKMTFQTDGSTLYSDVSVPPHLCGWHRTVHGGVLSTILDETMSWSAVTLLKHLILTKSIQVTFHKAVAVLTPLQVEGRVVQRTSDREALMEAAIYGPEGHLCCSAQGTFALFTPAAARRFELMPEKAIASFERFAAG